MTRTISPSQINTFEDCNRFWWFTRILRLKEPPGPDHFTFGTVLHAVCERYLASTANGRVPNPNQLPKRTETVPPFKHDQWTGGIFEGQIMGNPVDLYPEGWQTTVERFGGPGKTVTPTEAKLIKRLVTEAIEEGILQRGDGTTVERKIYLPVIDGVNLVGYIDVHRDANEVRPLPIIEDHKSYGKSSGRYLKRENFDSPNFLGKDQQLRTYAWAVSELDNHDGDVVVQHNQFPKFPGKSVTSVKATIPRAEIEEHGEYLRDVAGQMVRVAGIKKWDDVPGPRDSGKCARWYGRACPFSKICGRSESPEQHKVRVSRLLEWFKDDGSKPKLDLPLQTPRKRTKATGGKTVSIFDQAKKKKAAAAARKKKAGATEAKAATPPVNGAEPAPAAPAVVGGAPWANPECRACKGRGLTSKGKACPICNSAAKKAGRPTSMAYVLELDEDGLGVAVAREEEYEALEAADMDLEWVEADSSQPVAAEAPSEPAPAKPKAKAPRAKKKEKTPEPEEQAQGSTADGDTPEPEALEKHLAAQAKPKAKSNAGRPKIGLTILVGAVPVRGAMTSRTIITSAEVLARFGAELAADMGAESYYDLDSFKRRDRLAEKAAYIVSELPRSVLVHPGVLGNDDAGTLVQALMGETEGIEAVIVRTS